MLFLQFNQPSVGWLWHVHLALWHSQGCWEAEKFSTGGTYASFIYHLGGTRRKPIVSVKSCCLIFGLSRTALEDILPSYSLQSLYIGRYVMLLTLLRIECLTCRAPNSSNELLSSPKSIWSDILVPASNPHFRLLCRPLLNCISSSKFIHISLYYLW